MKLNIFGRVVLSWAARIPKGLRNKAQGCEERATLGNRRKQQATPTGLYLFCRSKVAQIFNLLYRSASSLRVVEKSRRTGNVVALPIRNRRYSTARQSRNQTLPLLHRM